MSKKKNVRDLIDEEVAAAEAADAAEEKAEGYREHTGLAERVAEGTQGDER